MKVITTLTNITGNYLKTGNSPRFFVHVATSERKWATATANDYTNRIQGIQSITDEIDAFGGMGTVSAANVDVLKLGEEIKFYTSASIQTRAQGTDLVGAARIKKAHNASYTAAREGATGDDIIFGSIVVGQQYDLTLPMYRVYRSALQFDIPAGITSCEDAYINLVGATYVVGAGDDFYIYAVLGTWTTGSLGTGSFDEFSGHKSGLTDYTGTILNEPLYTLTQFSLTATNRLRLNRAGRQQIVTNTGGVLKLMLLSSIDYTGEAPTGNEYVSFSTTVGVTPTLELIYNTVKPDNERSRIYLCYNDATTGIPASVSNMLNIWSGVVDSWSLDQKILSLNMRHDDFKRNVKLTADKIFGTAFFSNCPPDNVGKSNPIVIGDFMGNKDFREPTGYFTEKMNNTICSGGDWFKGLIVDTVESRVISEAHYVYTVESHAVFAGHALKEVGNFISLWNSEAGGYCLVPSVVTGMLPSGKYKFASSTAASLPSGLDLLYRMNSKDFPYYLTSEKYSDFLLNPIIVKPLKFLMVNNMDDYENSINIDPTDWSTITDDWTEQTLILENMESWGANGMFDYIAIVVDIYAPSGFGPNALAIHYVIYKDGDDNTAIEDKQKYIYGPAPGGDSETPRSVQAVYSFANTEIADSKVGVKITIEGTNYHEQPPPSVFDPDHPIQFRNVCVIRGYSDTIANEVYITGKGISDITGGYTGIEDALIENPSDIIRWFAVAKGGYNNNTEIDTSFVTARTALSAWKFAFQWNDDSGIENLFNYEGQKGIVDGLAAQCNATVWEDHLGKLKMKVFNATDPFPVSGTDVPADRDIFEYEGSPSSGSLTRHPIYSFSLDRITIDEAYTDFILKYRQNYATGEYNSILTAGNNTVVPGYSPSWTNIPIDPITEAPLYLETSTPLFSTTALARTELWYLMDSCHSDINTYNTLEIEAWAIRDEATATKLLQRLIQWHARRRFTITLTTGLNAIAFELGDFINVRTDDIEDQFGTAFMNCKKWKITKITTDLVGCKIEIEAIEAEIY